MKKEVFTICYNNDVQLTKLEKCIYDGDIKQFSKLFTKGYKFSPNNSKQDIISITFMMSGYPLDMFKFLLGHPFFQDVKVFSNHDEFDIDNSETLSIFATALTAQDLYGNVELILRYLLETYPINIKVKYGSNHYPLLTMWLFNYPANKMDFIEYLCRKFPIDILSDVDINNFTTLQWIKTYQPQETQLIIYLESMTSLLRITNQDQPGYCGCQREKFTCN